MVDVVDELRPRAARVRRQRGDSNATAAGDAVRRCVAFTTGCATRTLIRELIDERPAAPSPVHTHPLWPATDGGAPFGGSEFGPTAQESPVERQGIAARHPDRPRDARRSEGGTDPD